MTLSRIIKLRTDNGRSIIDFLIAVMNDRYEDFRICHRLQAARLLTTYGNEDAPNFIADNTPGRSDRHKTLGSTHHTKFDTELAKVIREDTDDGRSIARFLVNVMEGELRTFKPHHRMSAARELLDRGFGRSARAEPHVRPEPVEGPEPSTAPPTPPTDDLLDTLHHLSPQRFEHTVLDLLENMGYGRSHHMGRTGDGGIDGIIDQDALGLDRLYVQAKRWSKQVGDPEIRSFSGSLDPHGATRGIFITTSDFTASARRTAETISAGAKHIRLINGHELARLMITHNMPLTPPMWHRQAPDLNQHIPSP